MNLSFFNNKRVMIKCKDGEIFCGFAYDYTSANDNEPDPASITINHIEIFENEIESIEII